MIVSKLPPELAPGDLLASYTMRGRLLDGGLTVVYVEPGADYTQVYTGDNYEEPIEMDSIVPVDVLT